MWYILIFAAIILMVTCYVKARGMDNPHIRRVMARGKMTTADIYLSNRAAAIFAGSLVLLFIGASIFFSDPGGRSKYRQKQAQEFAWQRQIGVKLGEELNRLVSPESKALIIFQQMDQGEGYLRAFQEGLRAGTEGKISSFHVELINVPIPPQPEMAGAAIEHLTLDNHDLDEMVKKAGNPPIVISMVDLPHNVHESTLMWRALRKEVIVAASVTSVYNLGSMIQAEGLQAVVLPKQSFTQPEEGGDALDFETRYMLITPRNLNRTIQANRRIFKLTMKPE